MDKEKKELLIQEDLKKMGIESIDQLFDLMAEPFDRKTLEDDKYPRRSGSEGCLNHS